VNFQPIKSILKKYTKLHPEPEWHILHILTSEDIVYVLLPLHNFSVVLVVFQRMRMLKNVSNTFKG